jgi:hypothetical protein
MRLLEVIAEGNGATYFRHGQEEGEEKGRVMWDSRRGCFWIRRVVRRGRESW